MNQSPDNNRPNSSIDTDSRLSFADDFKRRVASTRPLRWLRFSLVALLFIAWVAWLGNWWVALLLILLFDLYITQYIPLGWWKKSKSKAVRSVMSWVDAIVYALVLVYFVFTFVGQNYQIPSSSLEKSLLVGDYLWVNKMAYGPRVPNTPLHFPLAQNTLPLINTKSYIDKPQWKYHRLKGYTTVKRGDIVVFNFPAGDTVALKMQNPDYYTLCRVYGRDAVRNNSATFGKIIYRPVDRRENYVKRAIGLPGDTLSIVGGTVMINSNPIPTPRHTQFNYLFQLADGRGLTDADWEHLGISRDDRHTVSVSPLDRESILANGFNINADGSVNTIYAAPLTEEMLAKLRASGRVARLMRMPAEASDFLFPDAPIAEPWTRADYGPIWIPKKGATIPLNADTWQIYGRAIRNYEHHTDAELRGNTVFINGQATPSYTFEMDYYFMLGDNRDNSLDSRYWGFVPEDHIVGRPELILTSFDKDKPLFNGGVRFDRILRRANPRENDIKE